MTGEESGGNSRLEPFPTPFLLPAQFAAVPRSPPASVLPDVLPLGGAPGSFPALACDRGFLVRSVLGHDPLPISSPRRRLVSQPADFAVPDHRPGSGGGETVARVDQPGQPDLQRRYGLRPVSPAVVLQDD